MVRQFVDLVVCVDLYGGRHLLVFLVISASTKAPLFAYDLSAMKTSFQTLALDGIPIVRLESEHLQVDVAPSVGGRVVNLRNKKLGHQFLWRNAGLRLEALSSGSEYDPNFFGGIDELLPNDIPEQVDGLNLPDHGELWTLPLQWEMTVEGLNLHGTLPVTNLVYQRTLSLQTDAPCIDVSYCITNSSSERRNFLWKLHAALAIESGDRIECSARQGQVVDPAWSRFTSLEPFPWPTIESRQAHIVPPRDGTVDFFYLFDLPVGRIAWTRPGANLKFAYEFDTKVFPFVWLFASYGGFDGHYTAILEPCTAMPISVNEAAARGQCTVLEPGQSLSTKVTIYAGSCS
jgi:hypothetical protein